MRENYFNKQEYEDAYDDYLIQLSRDKRAENYEDAENCDLNGDTSTKSEDNINNQEEIKLSKEGG